MVLQLRKKGQSGIEYLMTYGWALIVIVAAIGGLFAFGVFSPFAAPFCSGFSRLGYVDHSVDADGNFVLLLVNGNFGGISDFNIVLGGDFNRVECFADENSVGVGQSVKFFCPRAFSGSSGFYSGSMSLGYLIKDGVFHWENAVCSGFASSLPSGWKGILLESGFEEWNGSNPKDWIAADWAFTPQKGLGRSGSGFSFYFQDPPYMFWEWSALCYKFSKADDFAGKTLKASFWVKGDSNNVGLDYRWGFCRWAIDSPCYGTVLVDLHNSSWKDYNVTASIPANASGELYLTFPVRVGCTVPIICVPNKEPTNVWIDDVKIEVLN